MGNRLGARQLSESRQLAATAYQAARSEIAEIQSDELRDQLDDFVLESALMAYDLESVARGLSLRTDKGETPSEQWRDYLEGAWRFYTAQNYADVYERMESSWPLIKEYADRVREFDLAIKSAIHEALDKE